MYGGAAEACPRSLVHDAAAKELATIRPTHERPRARPRARPAPPPSRLPPPRLTSLRPSGLTSVWMPACCMRASSASSASISAWGRKGAAVRQAGHVGVRTDVQYGKTSQVDGKGNLQQMRDGRRQTGCVWTSS